MSPELIQRWLAEHLPESWLVESVELAVDNDEALIVVTLRDDRPDDGPDGAAAAFGPGAPGRIAAFREQTRDERIALAKVAERHFGRKVSWGARVGDHTEVFTSASVPVMTRLRMPERRVLDTLIDAGVARSRSDALSWCVRLVGDNEEDWIAALRAAFAGVEAVREQGPGARRPPAEG